MPINYIIFGHFTIKGIQDHILIKYDIGKSDFKMKVFNEYFKII